MPLIPRRLALKGILSATALAVPFSGCRFSPGASTDDDISASEREQMGAVAAAFMRAFDVPGLSVAISRGGLVVYENAFGVADRQSGERLTGANLFALRVSANRLPRRRFLL
jgi:CubicO group peptidase (beta-lactamase class C family)